MNNTIFFFFYNLAHQSVFFDKTIVFFAVYFPYVVVILAGLFLLFHHEVLKAESPARVFWEKKKEFIVLCLSGGVTWFLVKFILKILFHTPRPFVIFPQVHSLFAETGYAFPSGHTAVASAIAFSIFFLHKKAGYVFMFFALLIGIARITGGVHFPIDILGGFILGGTISYLVAYFGKNV